MKIKILKTCLSAAKSVGGEILLQGKALLSETKHPMRNWGESSVSDKIEIGESFFYRITYHTDTRYPLRCLEEKGIGRLDAEGRLSRDRLIYWTSFDGRENRGPEDFAKFPEDCVISISDYTPTLEICRRLFGNCIFSGNSVLILEKNQFVFCDENEEMQTGGPEEMQKLLNSTGKLTNFKQGIHLTPHNPPLKAKAGDLIFNKRSGHLEFYDGLEWKEIA